MSFLEKRPRESFSLKTDDIQGARPYLKSYAYTNKPEYANSTLGIAKSTPCLKSFITSRETNPLTPNYKLPSSVSKPITPPKFIRNTLDVSDIKGACSRPLFKDLTSTGTTLKDISGSFTERKTVTIRNPLNPEYVIRDKDNRLVKYGNIEGSKPKNAINIHVPPHNRNLDVSDIQQEPNSKSFVHYASSGACKMKISKLIANQISNYAKVASVSNNASRNPSPLLTKEKGFSEISSLNSSKSLKEICRQSFDLNHPEHKIVFTPKNKKKPLPRSPIFSPKAKK